MGLDKENVEFLFEINGTRYYKATENNRRYKDPQIVAFTRPIGKKKVTEYREGVKDDR